MGTKASSDDAPYRQGFFDDERRVSDILRNRHPTSAASDRFASNNAKAGNHDSSTPANRKSVFGQRMHPDPTYSRLDFGGSPFRDPISEINRWNLASDFDNDLHSYRALTVHNEPLEVFSRPIFIQEVPGASRNKAPADFGFSTTHDPSYRDAIGTRLDRHRNRGFSSDVFTGSGIMRTKQNGPFAGSYDLEKGFRPIVGNPYAFEAGMPGAGFRDTSKAWNPTQLTFRSFGTRIRHEEPSKCEYRFVFRRPADSTFRLNDKR